MLISLSLHISLLRHLKYLSGDFVFSMYNLPRYWKNETVLLYNILTTVAYKQKYIT